MEALGVFGVNWKLLFIQAVNFGFLLFVLWYFLYRPLMRMLEDRQAHIKRGVKDAHEAEQMRKQTEEEKQKTLADASNNAESIVKEARQRGEQEKEGIVSEARKTKEQILSDAQSQAEVKKEQVLENAQKEVAHMATLGAARILRDKAEAQRNGK